ncbi:MAG: S1-like domain-containing RNA-binding protein [Tissierellia bacterium]|nr:S1-like domain-containing RNA-binding protein [Tissierellia bacterium]
MIELGKTQVLGIKRFTTVGAFLGEDDGMSEDILLPRKFVKKDWQVGKKIEVFVYKDNENRLIATTLRPKIELGQLAILQVKDINKVGAFLDWGLEKDLYLPYEEQTIKVKKHDYYLVALYVDKSDRLTATMKVSPYFSKDVEYKENDWVEGQVYSFDYDIGAFILVDNKYNAMLNANEIDGILKVNDNVKLRVKNVKEDGKIDLTRNNRVHEQLGSDSERIYNILRDNGGYLKVGDHSDPKLIHSIFKMSKSQFKRSLGRLYKQRRIIFVNDGIKINDGGKNGR